MHNLRGFITIEIMLAVALMGVVFGAAMIAERGNAYWLMTSRSVGDDLLKAQARLESTAAEASADFFHLISARSQDDAACSPSENCDGVRRTVADVSSCAKDVTVSAERFYPGHPMLSSSLTTVLTDPKEAAALGGDCAVSAPSGNWSAPTASATSDLGIGHTTGMDVLDGVSYVVGDAPPYLRIVTRDGATAYGNGFVGAGPFNDVDVVRDASTGSVYAVVAAVSPQLQIIDVSDPFAPRTVGSAALAGVSLKGTQAQAWRVSVYGSIAYVAARYMLAPNPELHLFDISGPARPLEIGGGYKLNTSVYDLVVHEQVVPGMSSAHKRVLYAATTATTAELTVLDVTDPRGITTVATCDLPGNYQATSLALLGTALYAGRENVPNGGDDLYAFDASDPSSPTFCSAIARTDIGTDGFSRHVEALRASGPYLFVATSNTTNAHGQIQIRKADTASAMPLLAVFAVSGLTEHALEYENGFVYAASTATPQLQALNGL